jgi:hypothetical protein
MGEAEKAAEQYAPPADGYMANHGWEDLSDQRAAFIAGWQAHAAQPVSEAAVEAACETYCGKNGAFINYDDLCRRTMRAALEAALTVMREEQK